MRSLVLGVMLAASAGALVITSQLPMVSAKAGELRRPRDPRAGSGADAGSGAPLSLAQPAARSAMGDLPERHGEGGAARALVTDPGLLLAARLRGQALEEGEGSTQDDHAAVTRAQLDLPGLLADLRADDERWNATLAGRELWQGLFEGVDRVELRRLLGPLLASADDQERILATSLALKLEVQEARDGRPVAPNLHLQRTALSWLEARERPGFWTVLTPRRRDVVAFCQEYVDWLEPELLGLVRGGGPHARFEAAFVLASTGRARWTEELAAVLVPHLRDNDLYRDALESMYALKFLGRPLIPHLEVALAASNDDQQRTCLRALMAELNEPGSSRSIPMKGISARYLHPAADWTFDG